MTKCFRTFQKEKQDIYFDRKIILNELPLSLSDMSINGLEFEIRRAIGWLDNKNT
jgi:hypothetical protein